MNKKGCTEEDVLFFNSNKKLPSSIEVLNRIVNVFICEKILNDAWNKTSIDVKFNILNEIKDIIIENNISWI